MQENGRRPLAERRFFLALTVKNEAPNLWEWVAYHRAIGFTDIAIYQNDSEDGTQKILRTMHKAGFIQYFPNPSRNKGWQNKAYRRASRLEEFKVADWAMALDSDEFLVVKTGHGKVADLVDAIPVEATACTIHWKIFGSANHITMPEKLVTEAFNATEFDGRVASRMTGFKTIFRPTHYRRIGIHKPKDAFSDMPSVFCNGSGMLLDPDVDLGWRSKDVGRRRLAQVNHYAIRDLERFMVKSARGRTSNHERPVDEAYWHSFDFAEAVDNSALYRATETHAEMGRMDHKTRGRLAMLTKISRDSTHNIFRKILEDGGLGEIYNRIKSKSRHQAGEPISTK